MKHSQIVRVVADGRLLILNSDYKMDANGHITFLGPIKGTVMVETITNPSRKERQQNAQWKQRHYGPQRR